MSRRRLLCTALTLALSAAALMAQRPAADGQQDQQRPPVFRTESNFVRVDAYPTSDGKPVLDLTAEDFEILEDGVPQPVQTFEHVVVKPIGPQDVRVEPDSIRASRQMAANPRNRVFVLFLDTKHVTIAGSWNIREALVRLIDKILGPDDLIGVMTPAMAASDVVLARKTDVLTNGLMNVWPWGERYTVVKDDREIQYESCFMAPEQRGVVSQMVNRRRERMTLESLNELVGFLRGIREERKAILTVSEGWLLFREDQSMMALRIVDPATGTREAMPGQTPVGVGLDGRLTTRNDRDNTTSGTLNDCWEDRRRLSMLDDDRYFRDLLGEANRANASFYTVDPRGLPVFDVPLGPEPPPRVTVDAALLRNRQDSLRTLADNTDGIAVMNSNDMDRNLQRMADDLTSYYLLGYYSTNTKLDGKFRNIKVRVKRPGVTVRARRGYRAATADEVAKGKKAAAAPVPEIVTAMASAIGTLNRVRPGMRFFVTAVPVAAAGAKGVSTLWVAGELQSSGGGEPWLRGGSADIEVHGPAEVSATAQARINAGDRGFVVAVPLPKPVESGVIDVRVRLTGTDPAADRSTDSVSVDAAAGARPLAFRRGPTTGNRLQPAPTFHFNRTERARFEVPIDPETKPGGGRLVDRAGGAMPIPVTVGERADQQTGQRWLVADVTLAALAPGDYAVELTMTDAAGEHRILSAIRVMR